MEQKKGSLLDELNKNHRQWALGGIIGPPLFGDAWIGSVIGIWGADLLTYFALGTCAMATFLLPIRAIVCLIDKDDFRVVLMFLGLAAINAPFLYFFLR
ncbi:MAG: hypothetical protein IH944_06520 [Armatimonadetes bacterium]|nr:hypothetical protein [Armatimonadota bacterium]